MSWDNHKRALKIFFGVPIVIVTVLLVLTLGIRFLEFLFTGPIYTDVLLIAAIGYAFCYWVSVSIKADEEEQKQRWRDFERRIEMMNNE